MFWSNGCFHSVSFCVYRLREQSWYLDMSNSLSMRDSMWIRLQNALYTPSPECESTSYLATRTESKSHPVLHLSRDLGRSTYFTERKKRKRKKVGFSGGMRRLSNITRHLSRRQTGTLRSRNRSKNCHIHSLVKSHAIVCSFFQFPFKLSNLWCTKFVAILFSPIE